jgi:pyruvate,water dikinase
MEYILWLDQIKKESFNLVGGKAYNLGIITQLKLPVPPGFNITTKAFDEFLKDVGIKERIKKLIEECDVEDTQKLTETSDEIKNLIVNQEMSTRIRSEIIEAYRSLSYSNKILDEQALRLIASGRDFALVAVRSSATAEDLPSISKDEHVIVKMGDEIVYDKMEKIYELYEKNPTKRIFVPSLDGNKIDWMEVQELFKHPANNAKLFKITTKTGRHITITPNHSLIALDTNEFKTKTISMEDLRKDTCVPVVRYLPHISNGKSAIIDVCEVLKSKELFNEQDKLKIKDVKNWHVQNNFPRFIQINEDLTYFLGIFASEGSSYKSCIDISCQSKKIAKRVRSYLEELGLRTNKDPDNVRTFNKVLTVLLHELFGKPLDIKGKGRYARIKRVPNLIFNQPKNVIAEFLKGCFDGDGFIDKDNIGITSVSENLIGGIVKLLEMLEIKCYLRKGGIEIRIPPSEAEKFMHKIGFTEEKNVKKLNKIIRRYKKRKHNDVLDTIPASKKINSLIEESLKSKLNTRLIDVFLCPNCNSRLIKNGRYWKQRFLCKVCGKTFSSNKNLKKEKTATYLYYDELGRFEKNGVPWNKGNRKRLSNYSISTIKKIAERLQNEELLMIANSNILWDKIKKIEEVDYSGYVYDFVVPKTQNFCAGMGGIITHNTASFAGQQMTYLNVKGVKDLTESVKKCWASLYEPRAIFYRAKNNVSDVSICVIVQRMINSEKSGVMFTVNPTTGEDNIIIEACWGLGETLVQGEIEPDSYIISKSGEMIEKTIGRKEKRRIRDFATDRTIEVPVPRNLVDAQVLTEQEILKLADYGKLLEKHYGKAQDVEFAIEKNRIYIVQTRAVTTQAKTEEVELKGEPILKGLGSSPGVATGTVKIVYTVSDLAKVQKGDILVTRMTSPDMVVTMSRSSAIITDEGGVTCHASIVGREMGLPVIVGTQNATKILRDGQNVTVDAYHGLVYPGQVNVEQPELAEEQPSEGMITATKIKVNLAFPEMPEDIANKTDGIGLLRIEHMITKSGMHPAKLVREGRQEEYIKILMDDIRPIATAFNPKPVWARTLDARSDEFRNLEGGEEEPKEGNPMLGWHGIRRSLDEPEILKAEFEAIKRLHEEGLTNVHVMLPFVINVEEFSKAKEISREVGLPGTCKLGIMIETPAAAMIIEDFCKAGIDFISFGSNDLSQLTLGVDRNNAKLAVLFTETHKAVKKMMKYVIKVCKRHNVESSICGEAPSNIPEFVEFLVRTGIDSISVEIDAINKVRREVFEFERRMLLELARKK